MKRKTGCLKTVVTVLFLFAAGLTWFVHDIPSVDDHGLGVMPAILPAEQNGFPALLDATNAWVKSPEWVRDWAPSVTNASWDQAGAEGLVASNAAFFAGMERVLERGRFQSAIVTNDDDLVFPWLVPLSDWSRLIRVKSEWEFRQGDQAVAVESAFRQLRMGQMIQDGSGTLLEYLIASNMKQKGLAQVMSIGLRLQKPGELKALEKRLRPYQDAVTGYDSSIRGEYRLNRTTIGKMVGGDLEAVRVAYVMATQDPLDWMNDGATLPRKTGERIPRVLRRGMVRLILHPNRAHQWAADFDAELIAGREKPFRDAFGPVMTQAKAGNEEYQEGPRRFLLQRNALGALMRLEVHALATFESLRGNVSKMETKAAAVRLALLLRAYRLEKGGYPGHLEQLVPDYLPELPRDPFDGSASLRYHAAKQVVYAVGTDLKNDGGDPENDVVLAFGAGDE